MFGRHSKRQTARATSSSSSGDCSTRMEIRSANAAMKTLVCSASNSKCKAAQEQHMARKRSRDQFKHTARSDTGKAKRLAEKKHKQMQASRRVRVYGTAPPACSYCG